MAIRGLLFDKDGTLLDYHASWMPANRAVALYAAGGDRALASRILEEGGYDPKGDRMRANTVLAAATITDITKFLASHAPQPLPEDFAAKVASIFREQCKASELAPRARDAIAACRKGSYAARVDSIEIRDELRRDDHRWRQ